MKPTTRLAIATHAVLAVYFVSTAVIVTALGDDVAPKVIIQKQVVLGNEKRVIEVFITQLLTAESAKCFKALLMKESHINSKAKNPTSSAKGVGQLLDASYKNLGMRFSQDALSQTVAALAHIGRKFGSGGPCKAWEHFKKNNWY